MSDDLERNCLGPRSGEEVAVAFLRGGRLGVRLRAARLPRGGAATGLAPAPGTTVRSARHVPILRHEGRSIQQSSSIIDYLDATIADAPVPASLTSASALDWERGLRRPSCAPCGHPLAWPDDSVSPRGWLDVHASIGRFPHRRARARAVSETSPPRPLLTHDSGEMGGRVRHDRVTHVGASLLGCAVLDTPRCVLGRVPLDPPCPG